MKKGHAELLLAAVITARATSLLFSKLSLRSLGPFMLIGIRFSLAFLIMLLLFAKRFRNIHASTIMRGIILGSSFFAVMAAELYGLKQTDSATTAFLENTAIVWVPLIQTFLVRKLPGNYSLFCSALTLCGVACLTVGGSGLHLGYGELLCILASLFYAVSIILTDRFSRRDDPLLLGFLQIGTMALLGLTTSFLFETPALPQSTAEWGMIVALALVCTCFGFTLQPLAQREVPVEKAGMFCALNPLTAVVLGFVFLGERFNLLRCMGAILIAAAFLLMAVPEQERPAKRSQLKKS